MSANADQPVAGAALLERASPKAMVRPEPAPPHSELAQVPRAKGSFAVTLEARPASFEPLASRSGVTIHLANTPETPGQCRTDRSSRA